MLDQQQAAISSGGAEAVEMVDPRALIHNANSNHSDALAAAVWQIIRGVVDMIEKL